MYLSKILVGGSVCRNPYEIHRALWRLFPEDESADRDFLFCVRQSDETHAEILMQSERKPEKSSSSAQILASKEYGLPLSSGYRLHFRLIANPIKMINDEAGRKNAAGDAKKCRVPLIREDDQQNWLKRKLSDAASIEALTVVPVPPLRFKKSKEDRAGKVQPVLFEGVLKVEDPDAMTALIKAGIGPAKAFGCGLMLVRRILRNDE